MLPPLHAAAQAGNLSQLRQLLASGADPNEIASDDGTGGGTPLHYAMAHGRQAVIASLLQAGSSPNSRAVPADDTPLHLAARENHAGAVKQLVEAGADIEARMESGATPCVLAAQFGARDAVEALLAAGAGG